MTIERLIALIPDLDDDERATILSKLPNPPYKNVARLRRNRGWEENLDAFYVKEIRMLLGQKEGPCTD
jgi:hypothetical protein